MGSDESADVLSKAFPQYERRRVLELGDEAPVHRVLITRAFYLGQFEVSVGQFKKFIEASGYTPESVADGTGGYGYNANYDSTRSISGDAFEGRDSKYSWRNPGFVQRDNHPVVNVTWNDAVALAGWLSEREGVTYRLPTEAEWEYACRAGTRTRYTSGDNPESLLKIANVFDGDAKAYWLRWEQFALSGHDGYAFTSPVGSFGPMPGVSMICTATYGSGSPIGMRTTTTRDHPSTIRKDPPMAVSGYDVVVLGILGPYTHAHPIATGFPLIRATRWSGFVWSVKCQYTERSVRIEGKRLA